MDAGVGEAMAISALIGAGVGGATSAATGQDPLKGALIGGIGGAVTGGAMGAFGGGAAAATEATGLIGTEIASMTSAGATSAEISSALQATYGMTAEQAAAAMAQQASTGITNAGINMANASAQGLPGQVGSSALQNTTVANAGANVQAPVTSGYNIPSYEPGGSLNLPGSGLDYQGLTTTNAVNQVGPGTVQPPGTFGQGVTKAFTDNSGKIVAGGLGLGALTAMQSDQKKFGVPGQEHYDGPLSQFKYDPNTFKATYPTPPNPAYEAKYQDYRSRPYAKGGIADIDRRYANGGGIAGLLKGRGDGMSDSIHATIADKQPARLADGEFVLPADVVSHLGNGSTDAGAKQLYKMMDKVRQARTGNKKQGRQIAAGGYLPA
jgi:hypothetical protein